MSFNKRKKIKNEKLLKMVDKKEIIKGYLETEKNMLDYFKENKDKIFGNYYILNPNNIKKTKLISCFKKDLRCLEEHNKESVYLFCKKEDKIISRNLSKTKVLAKQFVIFNYDKDKLYIYGNERIFFSTFRKNKKEILKDTSKKNFEKEEKFIKKDFNSSEFVKNFLIQRDSFFIYEILFSSLDVFSKRIRAQFSSEYKDFDIIELLSKEKLKEYFLDNLKISSFKSINFKNSEGEQETLQFKNVGIGKIEIVWKRKGHETSLKKELCKIFNLYDDTTLVYQENFNLSTLFKEISLDKHKRNDIYKEILQKYGDFLYLDENHCPKLSYQKIIAKLRKILNNYKIEKVKSVKHNKLRFPKTKGKEDEEPFLVIKKGNKILTYLYLGESKLYEEKENFLREFFIFMPCLILDLRSSNEDSYYISCSNFLEKLLEEDKTYFEKIIETNSKSIISDIESECFKDIFNLINLDILQNFSSYNKNLISQQKGELYEKIVFFLFSILFKIERLGGPKKHDGNLFIHNSLKIGYDAKNLTKNNISSFTHSDGKFKDIEYIKKNNFNHYFFIFQGIEDTFFNSLVAKIKEGAPNVYIKAIDYNYILSLFSKIQKEGLAKFSRSDKQKFVEDLIKEKDFIIK